MESSTDCIKVISLDGHLEFMSAGGMCVMEVDDFGAIQGACWPDFWTGEEHGKARAAIDAAVAGGVGRFQGYTPTAKGNVRYWDVTVTPIRGDDGRPESLLSISRDITVAKETEDARARNEIALIEANERLEARVAERTADLLRAVVEAEEFNYSISHDLRTPLRAIASTSSILLEELGPKVAESYRDLLSRQVYNAVRLGKLIDELLRLSRLSRAELNRVPLDLATTAFGVFEGLRAEGRTNGCGFEVEPALVAEADPVLVRTILQSLIENACKFSPGGGTVRVGREGEAFFVGDEGIGFDMVFAPEVFLPFERLVSDEAFAGTGIGLANVKRIVERHKGRVWCRSAPGQGSTFLFTLG